MRVRIGDKKTGHFGKPLSLQVRDALAQRIARGEWAIGAALPDESALARELGVSPDTITKALDMLEAEQILSRRQGGSAVVNDQSSAAPASGCRFRDVEVGSGPADEKERGRLALDDGPGVFRIRRLRLLDGRPYLLEQSCFPQALFPGLPQRASAPYQLHDVASAYGVQPLLARERVSEIWADPAVAGRLEIPVGSAILVLDRVVCSSDRVPIEWRLAKCHLRGRSR